MCLLMLLLWGFTESSPLLKLVQEWNTQTENIIRVTFMTYYYTVGANHSIQRSPYTTRSLNTTILRQKEVKNMPCLTDDYSWKPRWIFDLIFLNGRETDKLSLIKKLFVCAAILFSGIQKLQYIAQLPIPEKLNGGTQKRIFYER